MTRRDPAADPDHDLRRHPQDPDGRQPWETFEEWRHRIGDALWAAHGGVPPLRQRTTGIEPRSELTGEPHPGGEDDDPE